jgi:hypothetical protein
VNVAPETCREKNEENKLDLLHLVGILFIMTIFFLIEFVMQTGCVLCDVWTKLLYVTSTGFGLHWQSEVCGEPTCTGSGLSQYLSFALSVSFHLFSMLIIIYVYMLPSPVGLTGEAWEPFRKRSLSGVQSIG